MLTGICRIMMAGLLTTVAMSAQDVHVRVSPDSTRTTASVSDFPTIQMALDHAPQPGPGGRRYLEIAPGIYHQRVIVTQNRPRTTMIGLGSKPGNAAAVFDDSEIHIIRPGYLTAQSRASPEQSTGFIFRHARITAADLGGREFYLGRPWRRFSRVVFLASEMPASLSPQGWSPWTKGGTIQDSFYAEWDSTGPGARNPSRLKGSYQLSREAAEMFVPCETHD